MIGSCLSSWNGGAIGRQGQGLRERKSLKGIKLVKFVIRSRNRINVRENEIPMKGIRLGGVSQRRGIIRKRRRNKHLKRVIWKNHQIRKRNINEAYLFPWFNVFLEWLPFWAGDFFFSLVIYFPFWLLQTLFVFFLIGFVLVLLQLSPAPERGYCNERSLKKEKEKEKENMMASV